MNDIATSRNDHAHSNNNNEKTRMVMSEVVPIEVREDKYDTSYIIKIRIIKKMYI